MSHKKLRIRIWLLINYNTCLILAEIPPVVYIHALFFESFLWIPYVSALAAELSHLIKIKIKITVLHITPMNFFPTHAFAFPFFDCVFFLPLSVVVFVFSLQHSPL